MKIDLNSVKQFLRSSSLMSLPYSKSVRLYHSVKRRFPRSYQNWIKHTEKFEDYVEKPSDIDFHIIFDVRNTTDGVARRILSSVLSQKFPHWQLTVISHNVKCSSEAFSKLCDDHRINVKSVENTFCCQTFLEGCPKWTLILSENYLLSPYCLAQFNDLITSSNMSCALAYSDHDELNTKQKRVNPNFKPDWNPDLFYSQDYLKNCSIYNTDKLDICSFKGKLFTREHFYYLTLQASTLPAKPIIHTPKVLFHQINEHRGLEATLCQQALQELLDVKGIKLCGDEKSGVKIAWPIISEPLVSLIIPTRNGLNILKQAVDSILNQTNYSNYEIIIVDNQTDCLLTLEYLSEIERNKSVSIRVFKYDHDFNYSAINNFAVEHASGSVLGFVNNDIEVISPNWLTEMVSHAIRPEIGCVGAKLYYANDTIQHAGVIVGLWGCAGHSHKRFKRDSDGYCNRLRHVQNYSAVTAACLLIKKELFLKVKGFNEQNLPVQFNDVDLCLKVHALGYRNLWTPYAELYHHESISRGNDSSTEELARSRKEVKYMHDTWLTYKFIDDAYSPNLTDENEDFSLTRRRQSFTGL